MQPVVSANLYLHSTSCLTLLTDKCIFDVVFLLPHSPQIVVMILLPAAGGAVLTVLQENEDPREKTVDAVILPWGKYSLDAVKVHHHHHHHRLMVIQDVDL